VHLLVNIWSDFMERVLFCHRSQLESRTKPKIPQSSLVLPGKCYDNISKDLKPVACHTIYTIITSQWAKLVLGRLVEVSRSHTIRYRLGRTRLDEWSVRRRGRYQQNAKQTIIFVLSEIRTRHPSNQAAAEAHFRLHGQCDLLLSGLLFSKFPTVWHWVMSTLAACF